MYKLRITVEARIFEEKEQFKKDFALWMQERPVTVIAKLVDPNEMTITGGPPPEPREKQAALPLSE